MRGLFVTGQPTAHDRAALRVHGAVGRTFGELTGQVLNPTMRGYVADMAAPYGLAVREDLIDRGVGHSYGEMCAPLLAELVAEDQPADLLVLATEIPDVRYGRSTATVLGWHCPGAPLAFTVCDQGLLAAFTALHLIEGYARTGDCRRAVLLVAEQPTLYHDVAAPTPLPAHAAAVGVVLGTDGPPGALSVRRHTRVAGHDVAGTLAAEVAGLAADGQTPAVLLGPNLTGAAAHLPGAGEVPACGADQPLTGIWLALAQGLPEWRESGAPVLLAEYDPALGYLFSASFRFGG